MVHIIVGLVIIGFVVAVYRTSMVDFTEDVTDISPFFEDVVSVQIIQKFSLVVTRVMGIACLGIAVYSIIKGLGSVV